MTVQRLEAGTRPTNVDELVSIAALFNIPVTLLMEPLNDLDDPRWSTQPVMYDWLRRAAMEWVDRGFPRLGNQDGQDVSTPRLDRLVAEETAGALAAVAAGRAQGGVANDTATRMAEIESAIEELRAFATQQLAESRKQLAESEKRVAELEKKIGGDDVVDKEA